MTRFSQPPPCRQTRPTGRKHRAGLASPLVTLLAAGLASQSATAASAQGTDPDMPQPPTIAAQPMDAPGLQACRLRLRPEGAAIFITATIAAGPGTEGRWQLWTRHGTSGNIAEALQSGRFQIAQDRREITLSRAVIFAGESLRLWAKMQAQDAERTIECETKLP